jgi:hypothetical protein
MRTQSVKITYIQNGGTVLSKGRGILLEHKDDIAKRLGWKELKLPQGDEDGEDYILQPTFPVEDFARMALAQAAIAHTDWGPNYNTIRYVDAKGVQRLVAYDFDQCGFNTDEFTSEKESPPMFSAAAHLQDERIQEIISWRADAFKDENLDFEGATKKVAAELLKNETEVNAVIAKVELTPKGRRLIEKRIKHFLSELKKMK